VSCGISEAKGKKIMELCACSIAVLCIMNSEVLHVTVFNSQKVLKLVVCILLCVLGQVQGFRLTQHWFEYFIQYLCRGYNKIFKPVLR
jgi:hypothetical protein